LCCIWSLFYAKLFFLKEKAVRMSISGLRLPKVPRPIVMIGAGGIAGDAHLPAYRKAGFEVASIFDLDRGRAMTTAERFGIRSTPESLRQAVASAPLDAVFDIATPAGAYLRILSDLPDGRGVLLQKPLGENLDEARKIRELCRAKRLKAAVNFQLRYAPAILAAKDMIAAGSIGQLHDMEVRVTVFTPWHLWTFLESIPRVEILYHSVHYIDLIRSILGDPVSVYAKTVKHPKMEKLASTRSNIILDYGDTMRANITTNHGHEFGVRHQESYVKWEGTGGAIKTRLGLLMDYPQGAPDEFEYCILDPGRAAEWKTRAIDGTWFPDAFIGPMADLMCFLDGLSDELPTSVEDAYKTMAIVEAAYQSSVSGGTRIGYD
jgi:predicted dehydrogenase